MPRTRKPYAVIAAVAVIAGVLAVLLVAGQQLLRDYAWAVLPAIFGAAIVARVVDEYRRRRRLSKFKR